MRADPSPALDRDRLDAFGLDPFDPWRLDHGQRAQVLQRGAEQRRVVDPPTLDLARR